VDEVPVEDLSFEQAQAELERVIEALEDRNTGLDEALRLWERGEALHAWCRSRLEYAAARMQQLAVTPDEVAEVLEEQPDAFAAGAGTTGEPPAADPSGGSETIF